MKQIYRKDSGKRDFIHFIHLRERDRLQIFIPSQKMVKKKKEARIGDTKMNE